MLTSPQSNSTHLQFPNAFHNARDSIMDSPYARALSAEVTDSPSNTSSSNDASSRTESNPDDLMLQDRSSWTATSLQGDYDCDISLQALRSMIEEGDSLDENSPAFQDQRKSFMDLLVSEAHRIGLFVELEENKQELDAKAFLSKIDEDLLKKPSIDGMDTISYLKMRARDLATSILHLQSFRVKAKANLQDVAVKGAGVLGTNCAVLLEEKFAVSPWRASSTHAVVFSDIHEAIRSAQSNKTSGSAKWEAPSSFQRATTKYWVEEDNLLELLLACAKEVPLLVYGKSGRLTLPQELVHNESDKLWKALASPISSVYFDSPKMSLYTERIARKEGAQLLRVRWYGKKPQGDGKVFVELKTHHEKWINTASVKERVTIREKHMRAFLERRPWDYHDAEPIVRKGNSKLNGEELSKAAELLLRMHELVLHQDLCPCVRSVYLRAAFQSATSNSLRLTLDRDIMMIDETGAPMGDWCINDELIDVSRMKRVPFPVFEVKLAGSEMPPPIATLIAEGVVEEAAKFSKFLTGAAAFNANKVKTLPYWAEHPAFEQMLSSAAVSNPRSSGAKKTASSEIQVPTPVVPRQTRGEVSFKDPIVPKARFDSLTKSPSMSLHSSWMSEVSLFSRGDKKPKIAPKARARVEPKSYFANERTFIQWTSSSLWLLTVAALLVERDPNSSTWSVMAVILCIGAILVLLHSFRIYFLRIKLLETGNPNGYVDRLGPIVLSGSVLLGIIVLLISKIQNGFVTQQPPAVQEVLRAEPGRCYMHSMSGISALKYQPSDIIFDKVHNMLLVPSLDRIVGHSTANLNANVTTLVKIPGTDLESLTMAGDRIFALSEATGQYDDSGALIELEWVEWEEGHSSLEVVQRYGIGNTKAIGEGLTFIPGEDGGNLCVDTDEGILTLFKLPPPRVAVVFKKEDFVGPTAATTVVQLSKVDGMNRKLMLSGLEDGKIASLYFFEGNLYVLHDNDKVIRSWNIATGEMVSEIPLPRVIGAAAAAAFKNRQWEGLAITRNDGSLLFPALSSGLRGNQSPLILHLTLDSPPQVWSFAVGQDTISGHLVYPDCAGV